MDSRHNWGSLANAIIKRAYLDGDADFMLTDWAATLVWLGGMSGVKSKELYIRTLIRQEVLSIMADMNVCTLTGRLTKDATLETVGAKGTPLLKFDLANNTGYGQYARTQFFQVQMWGKSGEGIVQYLKKGKQVCVSGLFENNQWTNKEGKTIDNWRLTANQVTLLADSKGQTEAVSTPAESNGEMIF